MKITYQAAMERGVFPHEGGYTNDPRDPGGETNWGISKRAYPNLDIKNLAMEEAKRIYKRLPELDRRSAVNRT